MPVLRSGSLRAGLAALALSSAALVAPRPARAFCGFYVSGSGDQLLNKATRVALMREGTTTVLTMSNDYQGPPQDFAMVVPVPVVLQRENVRTLPHDVFNHLETLTAPRLVEYWEQDPCRQRDDSIVEGMTATASMVPSTPEPREDAHGVRVEARFVVGEYEVVVLSASQSDGLEAWLRENRYNIPRGVAEYLAPYVREQWKFFVARVDIERVERRPDGSARLSPLRFHYDAREFRLPVRLGLLNAPEAQDLIVYVLHPTSRFEVANYRNVFIPTNLDVADQTRRRFAEFYAGLFDATMEAAGRRAVVTEYAWDTGTCDPCPSPPLEEAELATLGADVLPSSGGSYHGGVMAITRLHTRYNRATLTEDLVFREAPAVTGGREVAASGGVGVEQGATPTSDRNAFQARYAIRHPWTGPIECSNPRRGVWGSPPEGQPQQAVLAARDLAEAPRGAVNLQSMVLTPTPGITSSGALGTPSSVAPGTLASIHAPPARRGCACEVTSPTARGGATALAAVGALVGILVKRARRRRP